MQLERLTQEITEMEAQLSQVGQFNAEFILRTPNGSFYTYTGWQLVDYEGAKGVVMDVTPFYP